MWVKISPTEKIDFFVDLTKSFIFGGVNEFNNSLSLWEDTAQILRDKILMDKIGQIRQRSAHLE